MPRDFRDVDPRELRVPSSRPTADPFKYAQQVRRFGGATATMPPILVYEGTDGHLVIYNGATRATRVAALSPGTLVRVEVLGRLRRTYADDPKIGDSIP